MIKVEFDRDYKINFKIDSELASVTINVLEKIEEFHSTRTHCTTTIDPGEYTLKYRYIYICKNDGTPCMTWSDLKDFADRGIIQIINSEIVEDNTVEQNVGDRMILQRVYTRSKKS